MISIIDTHPIIPVVALEKVEHAVPLAESLLSSGISVLEVTLRTDAAIESITKIINSVPELTVGSGTVCNERQFKISQDIGCKFIVSPGLTPSLLNLARESQQDYLPGISSASDIMLGLEYGFTRFKFFPAESLGGVNTLKSLKGPFSNVKFCDDAFTNSDPERVKIVKQMLGTAVNRGLQVILLTCDPGAYGGFADQAIELKS